MGAGATQRSIELILAVDEIIVISTTEPTSITDAYSMMKFICLQDPEKAFHIVSNRVSKGDDGNDAVTRLQYAMRKFLGKETTILGFLPEDPVVHKAVLAQKPFILLFPNAPISKRMMAIAETFVGTSHAEDSLSKGKGSLENYGVFLRKDVDDLDTGNRKKALVVDDSAFMRKLISDFLSGHPEIEVIGTARNGKDAVEKVKIVETRCCDYGYRNAAYGWS